MSQLETIAIPNCCPDFVKPMADIPIALVHGTGSCTVGTSDKPVLDADAPSKPMSSQVSTDDSSRHAETKLGANCKGVTSGHVPCFTQIIEGCKGDTKVDVTFVKRDGKYDAEYAIVPIGHNAIPMSIIELWMQTITDIISGKQLETRYMNDWNSESQLNFLKAATLVSRTNEVAERYRCAKYMDSALEWAHGHGIHTVRTWKHSDRIVANGCKLAYTLQKWNDTTQVACVYSEITGYDPVTLCWMATAVQKLTTGQVPDPACKEAFARAAIFADEVAAYEEIGVTDATHHNLAKKYDSLCMCKRFETPIPKWTLQHCGSLSCTLTKRDGKVVCDDLSHTIDSVLSCHIVLDDIAGGPQMWAEIAAFAGHNYALDVIGNFARGIGSALDTDRINAAAAAGKTQ